jgi:hypothetical protein
VWSRRKIPILHVNTIEDTCRDKVYLFFRTVTKATCVCLNTSPWITGVVLDVGSWEPYR